MLYYSKEENVLTFLPLMETVKRGQKPCFIPLLLSNSSIRCRSFLAVSSKSTCPGEDCDGKGGLAEACRKIT